MPPIIEHDAVSMYEDSDLIKSILRLRQADLRIHDTFSTLHSLTYNSTENICSIQGVPFPTIPLP